MLNERGCRCEALPLLTESIHLLRENWDRSNPVWGMLLSLAGLAYGRILQVCGRPAEAVPVLKQALQTRQRMGAFEVVDVDTGRVLAELYIEMGDYQRAIAAGLKAEAILTALATAQGAPPGNFGLREKLEVLARLVEAYDGAGDVQNGAEHHERVMALYAETALMVPQMISCCRRDARKCCELGQPAAAEYVLRNVLTWYKDILTDSDVGLGAASSSLRRTALPALRMLVDVRRALGNNDEARALEQALDETEAI